VWGKNNGGGRDRQKQPKLKRKENHRRTRGEPIVSLGHNVPPSHPRGKGKGTGGEPGKERVVWGEGGDDTGIQLWPAPRFGCVEGGESFPRGGGGRMSTRWGGGTLWGPGAAGWGGGPLGG